MKATITLLAILLVTLTSIAQNGINYKAVIKDGSGNILANQTVLMYFTILENTTSVYSESQTLTTDANGLIIVTIGEGNIVSGSYNGISWGHRDHYIKVELEDATNGPIDLGTTKFNSVPYALHADTAKSLSGIQYSTGALGPSQNIRNTWIDYTAVTPIVVAESGTYKLSFYGWGQNLNSFNSAVTGNDHDGNMQVRVYNTTTAQEILLMNATLQYIDVTNSGTFWRFVNQSPSTWRIVQLNAGDEIKIQYNQWSFFSTHSSNWQMGPSGISIVKIGD